jgi:hypothetical protein
MALNQWVEREFAIWEGFDLRDDTFHAELARVAAENFGVFHFSIRDGRVSYHDKSDDAAFMARDGHRVVVITRANLYMQFLQNVVSLFAINGSCDFLIDVEDLSDAIIDFPVFRFQKIREKREILLPDIDFLERNFYVDIHDDVEYVDKIHAAAFVGATTGDPVLTQQHVETLANRRLRSAAYFRDVDCVRFDLPLIVQCDAIETVRMIEAMNVSGQYTPWNEQLRWRYLLSLDGNGATCSRVALSLMSNSVLMKYHSENRLYYFDGLEPWRDYIPIYQDRDVGVHVERARLDPDAHGRMAARSRDFARRHLSRIEVMRYMAKLIQRYMVLTGQGVRSDEEGRSIHNIDCSVHVGHVGTLWAQGDRWAGQPATGTIEGFTLYPGEAIDPEDLEYQFVMEDGGLSLPSSGHEYCGTRGQHRPIHGVRISLAGAASQAFQLSVSCRFAGEEEVRQGGSGDVVRSTAALQALQVMATPRTPRPASRLGFWRGRRGA